MLPEEYTIAVDVNDPLRLQGSLRLTDGDTIVWPARQGDFATFDHVRCSDGRIAKPLQSSWQIPLGCRQIEWDVRIVDLNQSPTDATMPQSGHDTLHDFWLISEASALIRRSDQSAEIAVRICANGVCRDSTPLVLPSAHQPPLYAVIGEMPVLVARRGAITVKVHGARPDVTGIDAFPHALAETMALWGQELGLRPGPGAAYDWVWLAPAADQPPGFYASAGLKTFVSQLVAPENPEDGTPSRLRAIIWTGAAHEAFHSLSGQLAVNWPAWVNESLASYFALESARERLDAADFASIERQFVLYSEAPTLQEAQRRYDAGDGNQRRHFYVVGVHFWRAVADHLDGTGSGRARLARMIRRSNGFARVDLTDPVALIQFIKASSSGEVLAKARCLLNEGSCSESPKGDIE